MLKAKEPHAIQPEDLVSDMRRMARRFLRSDRAADRLASKTLLRARNELAENANRRNLRLRLVTIMREIVVSETGHSDEARRDERR